MVANAANGFKSFINGFPPALPALNLFHNPVDLKFDEICEENVLNTKYFFYGRPAYAVHKRGLKIRRFAFVFSALDQHEKIVAFPFDSDGIVNFCGWSDDHRAKYEMDSYELIYKYITAFWSDNASYARCESSLRSCADIPMPYCDFVNEHIIPNTEVGHDDLAAVDILQHSIECQISGGHKLVPESKQERTGVVLEALIVPHTEEFSHRVMELASAGVVIRRYIDPLDDQFLEVRKRMLKAAILYMGLDDREPARDG